MAAKGTVTLGAGRLTGLTGLTEVVVVTTGGVVATLRDATVTASRRPTRSGARLTSATFTAKALEPAATVVRTASATASA